MTTTWASHDLDAIGNAREIAVAPHRPDGSLKRFTTIWVVRVGDELYVRSYRGPDGSWYRTAQRTHTGRVRAGGVDRDVAFDDAADVDRRVIDDTYRAKYGRSSYVDAMVTADAAATTMRLLPR